MSGSVLVTSTGERLKGTVSHLRLEGFSSDSTSRTIVIDDGEFDLPLLTGGAAQHMSYCFLENALGRACGG